ncbi:MAG: HDIG domain-containing metalloprotein [Nanoarchaeota archaeon]
MEEKLIKITPNEEKARSILKMAETSLEMIKQIDEKRFPSIFIKEHYEIIRELISIILLLDGFKASGEGAHKKQIEYLEANYKEFNKSEIMLIDELRLTRNKIAYDGFFIKEDYIERKMKEISEVIDKLMLISNKKLKLNKKALPISREQAWELVKKYNSDEGDLNHYLESEAVMRGAAKRLGENEDYYGMLGLVHDIDWGLTKENSVEHLTKAPSILKEAGFDEEFISIIVSHGCGFDCAGLKDKKRTKKIEYALAAAETLTGLIHAYALMRKTIEGMEASGLMKKFKDKKFAAAINRDIIKECELVGISLDDFFTLSIDAIRKIKNEVGLE